MYLKKTLLLLILFGTFIGALSNANPFMRFPSDNENVDVSRDTAKGYDTAELYKLLDDFGVAIKDLDDVSS